MMWFDVTALLLLGLIAWAESVRGFGRALFDLVGGVIALKFVPVVASPLANMLTVFAEKGANHNTPTYSPPTNNLRASTPSSGIGSNEMRTPCPTAPTIRPSCQTIATPHVPLLDSASASLFRSG